MSALAAHGVVATVVADRGLLSLDNLAERFSYHVDDDAIAAAECFDGKLVLSSWCC